MLAVVLVGGLGTRLREVVGEIQKPMVEIEGKAFLEYLVRFLIGQGVKRFVFCVGYKAEMVEQYFGDGSDYGVEMHYSYETQPLGTAGAVKNAEEYLKEEEDFLLLNGDSFVDFDLTTFRKFFGEKKADFLYLVTKSEEKERFGNLVLDQSGKLLEMWEKKVIEDGGFISAGVYWVKKNLINLIPDGVKYSLETDWVPQLMEREKSVFGFVTPSDLIDIGTPQSLEYFKQNRQKFFQ